MKYSGCTALTGQTRICCVPSQSVILAGCSTLLHTESTLQAVQPGESGQGLLGAESANDSAIQALVAVEQQQNPDISVWCSLLCSLESLDRGYWVLNLLTAWLSAKAKNDEN